ncbi:hypothetical protein [Marinomonas mediterranea]|uniref:hypothetical protein n=1 Tax=Marinomonas mediterranea TaxID=119864 RepID=UPI00234B85E0|nr:hypothetical protein [Marinomonas mediterranea]WCN09983.1 hypothetical protein GV055_14165 [Marinomonas mediterranea]
MKDEFETQAKVPQCKTTTIIRDVPKDIDRMLQYIFDVRCAQYPGTTPASILTNMVLDKAEEVLGDPCEVGEMLVRFEEEAYEKEQIEAEQALENQSPNLG